LAAQIGTLCNDKTINWENYVEEAKKRLKDPEADEFEGEVPFDEVTKEVMNFINAQRGNGCNFIFAGLTIQQMNWAIKELGPPRWWLPIMCNKETAGIAWRKANEGAEEVSEEGAQEIADGGAAYETEKAEMAKALQDGGYNMTKYETLNVDKSAESVA
jgi:hypothetical protein